MSYSIDLLDINWRLIDDVAHSLISVYSGYIFWTYFRLGLWTAMHLRMHSSTPSVYLDLFEGRVEQD